MDEWDNLVVRFHFGGSFVTTGGQIKYVGGETALSSIEFDKLSLPEINGHLRDHFNASAFLRLHWLQPGKQLSEGLMLLTDDGSYQLMAKHFTGAEVADIYVEVVFVDQGEAAVGDEVNDVHSPEEMKKDKDLRSFMEFCRSPSKGKNSAIFYDVPACEDTDTSDEDYQQPAEDNSSADDEEAEQFKKFAKDIKRDIRANKLGVKARQIKGTITDAEVDDLQDVDSPYYDSSDDYSYEEDSEGETQRWKSVENKFDSSALVPVFALGMAFIPSRQFKKALVKYGLKTHKHPLFPKDEKNRVRATCSWQGCKWLIYGSKTSRSEWFKVVTFVDEHCCPPRRDNKLVTSRIIANRYADVIRDNPTWKVEIIKRAVLKDMLADVSLSKCKRVKALVLQEALDATRGEYSKVYDYQLELLRSNPGSTVVVTLDPEIEDKKVFERFYVCLDACKKGFMAGCRRVIGLDGCWFKGANNGELLCAIGRDANNQMYPIGWAAVTRKDYDSWYWFIGLLQKDLNINVGGEGWVIISDQQKGLLKAVGDLVPNCEHRMCARHIYANWRKTYTDRKLQNKWWSVAKASSPVIFNYNKAKLAQDTPEGANDMMKTSPEHWSRAYFKLGSNCDFVDNNMCESFNNSIMDSRFMPVISMHEAIRCKVMVRIQENRAKAEKWQGTICPNIFNKFKLNIVRSGNCYVLWNGEDGFEVTENNKWRHTVNLDLRTCSCRYWQLSGLPCCHAISAIYKASKALDDFIAPCFTISEYKKTYQYCLQPVEGQQNWPISDMPRPLPPPYVRMPGRPKTQRTREPGEAPKGTKLSKVGIKMKCRLCQKSTHNARRCPKNPEAGKKKNAYIKRDARKRKRNEESTFVAGTSNARGGVGTQESTNARPQFGGNITGRAHAGPGSSNIARRTPPQAGSSTMSGMRHLLFGNNY